MDCIANTRIVLERQPDGVPKESDFRIETCRLPPLQERQLLLRTQAISIDWCGGHAGLGTSPFKTALRAGEVVRCCTVSEVVQSLHAAFRPGDVVLAHSGWQECEVVDGASIRRKLHGAVAPATAALGVYGAHGHVAFKAMREVARPMAGETVVVGSAASPIGETAGQIARHNGARVVGVTSSDEKCEWLREGLGFDAAVNIHGPHFGQRLRLACPEGIDVLLLGINRALLATALPLLNTGARVPVWGCASDGSPLPFGARDGLSMLLDAIIDRRIAVSGYAHAPAGRPDATASEPEFVSQMGRWLRQGVIRYREDVVQGIHSAPAALQRLLEGDNFGKLIVALD
ncbi:MAG: NADP-dependent oxidoreductase [Pseudoxanthomonas sp.]